MTTDIVGVSVSLFCVKRHFHHLLKKGVEVFLERHMSQVHDLEIRLSDIRGEHILLVLWCDNQQARTIAKNADLFFKDFFISYNFTVDEIVLPVPGIFMPFPANTVRYGLHIAKDRDPLRTKFSAILIEAMGSNEIDDESIITFAFYLYLGMIRKRRIVHFSHRNYNYAAVHQLTKPSVKHEEDLFNEYLLQEDLLVEIAREVMLSDEIIVAKSTSWMGAWLALCEPLTIGSPETAHDSHLVQIINEQVGLGEESKMLLNCFLNNALAACQVNHGDQCL
ncbi:hypothetical protein [Hufsiella ginkgonis]|uniref:Uncharacterized protein n=1 Tax=Hufsiella ginkgonis TaxID=2695274 RepID=A0A7K1XSF7_9SPHI|nr:hypothetical protein [Hufsiella ginkgonis]MXV13894.1 hypothetical protein [Hufsiella ginkgonis]